jgi:hypothetical protein
LADRIYAALGMAAAEAGALMVSSNYIHGSAQELIKQHGLKGASSFALGQIEAFEKQGNEDGANLWRAIRGALLDVSDIRFKDDPVN